jgi:hypothetical protein
MSKKQKKLTILISMIALIGIASFIYLDTAQPINKEFVIKQSINEEPIITLFQGVPMSHVFHMSIYENGRVVFEGSRVPISDTIQEVRISKKEVAYLTTKMIDLDIFNTNKPTEGLLPYDRGITTVSLNLGGKSQTISYYFGDPGISRELIDFEQEVMETIGVRDLLKFSG